MRRREGTGFGGEEPKAHGGWGLGRETWQLHCDGPQALGEQAICSAGPSCLVPWMNRASGVPERECAAAFSEPPLYLKIRPRLARSQTTESSTNPTAPRLRMFFRAGRFYNPGL